MLSVYKLDFFFYLLFHYTKYGIEESFVIQKKVDIKIFTEIHVFSIPDTEKVIFGILSICVQQFLLN